MLASILPLLYSTVEIMSVVFESCDFYFSEKCVGSTNAFDIEALALGQIILMAFPTK